MAEAVVYINNPVNKEHVFQCHTTASFRHPYAVKPQSVSCLSSELNRGTLTAAPFD